MKHLKDYIIFESTNVDDINTMIMDTMASVIDSGYEVVIYDYYRNKLGDTSSQIDKNINSIGQYTIKSKVIKIDSGSYNYESVNIESYRNIGLPPMTSGSGNLFKFIDGDLNLLREFYIDLFDAISHLSEYKPKIWTSSLSTMIMIDIGLVDEPEIIYRNKIISGCNRLFTLLKEANVPLNLLPKLSNGTKIIVHGSGENTEVIRSLCSNIELSRLLVTSTSLILKEIRRKINEDGFDIKYNFVSVLGQFHDNIELYLVEK